MEIFETLLNIVIPAAQAADIMPAAGATPGQTGGGMSLFIILGIFVVFMYFTMWRPQSKRAKEHRNLMDSLVKGDEVVTAGGMLGKVAKVSDKYIVLAIADAVEVTVQKSSIAGVLPKGTLKAI